MFRSFHSLIRQMSVRPKLIMRTGERTNIVRLPPLQCFIRFSNQHANTSLNIYNLTLKYMIWTGKQQQKRVDASKLGLSQANQASKSSVEHASKFKPEIMGVN